MPLSVAAVLTLPSALPMAWLTEIFESLVMALVSRCNDLISNVFRCCSILLDKLWSSVNVCIVLAFQFSLGMMIQD